MGVLVLSILVHILVLADCICLLLVSIPTLKRYWLIAFVQQPNNCCVPDNSLLILASTSFMCSLVSSYPS